MLLCLAANRRLDCISFDELCQGSACELTAAPTSKDDAAFWLYSSGSTGQPKACVHLQHDMVVSTERYAKAILKITESDRFFQRGQAFLRVRSRKWALLSVGRGRHQHSAARSSATAKRF